VELGVVRPAPRRALRRRALRPERLLRRHQIGPGAEGLARAREDDHARLVVGVAGAETVSERRHGRTVERVLLLRVIERHPANAATKLAPHDLTHFRAPLQAASRASFGGSTLENLLNGNDLREKGTR